MSFLGGKKKKSSKEGSSEGGKIQEEKKYILSSKSGFYVREAYNTLRTNVMFSLTGDESCKIIMITSSAPTEGKTITGLNFAINMAEADCKVLLVDADMRKPKVNRLTELSSAVGLSNVLMNLDKLDEAILPYEKVSKLDVILSGSIPPNPSELLASQRMQRLLNKLKERYDYIIIDTPPINMVTDAVVLAPMTNGVLFVVRQGETDRSAVVAAVEQLEYAQAKILGFVFNGADLQKVGYGYGKYKYKKYGYYGRFGYRRGYGYGYRRGGYGYGYGGYGYGYGYGHRDTPQIKSSEDISQR